MPALTPKVFSLSLDRDANTRPKVLRHFQATPCIWRLSLGTGVTFDEATRVAVELNTKSDGTGEVLAAAETTAGLDDEATSIDVQMTAAQWNQSIPSGKTERILWAVAFIEYPDDRLEVHTVAKVTLVRHSASQTTPAPPEPAVYLSQAALDAAVAALEAEIAALSSVHNDLTSRDAANAHPMSAITGLTAALDGKAAASHTHAQSDVTNLVTDLAGKAASSHTHGMGDVTGLSAALALLAPLASPQLTGRARITDTNNAGLEFWKTTHGAGDRNWEIAVGTEEAGEMELWAGLNGTNNDPRGGTLAARFGVTANSGGPHFTGAVSVGDVAGTRTNLGLTALATTTPGTGVATFLATPSSANLAAALTDKTGSGAAVFANGPALVAPSLGTPASGTLTNCTIPASGISSGIISDARLYPLRPGSFAGTYDDDFTGSGLDAKWSRQGLVSGDHTYQTGNGSWMSMSIAAGTTGYIARSIHQAWTPADSTITCRLIYQQIGSAYPMMGPFIVDSSGNGVGVTLFNNANSFCIATLASWVFSSFALYVIMGLPAHNVATGATGIWFRLRKSGTTYYASVSFDGLFWTPEVSAVNTTTMTRAGMGTFFRWGGSSDYGAVQHFDFFHVE